MKVAFDAKRAFLNRSGLGNYSRSIINLLYENYRDHQYYLFTPDPGQELFCPEPGQQVVTPSGFGKHFPSIWRSYGIVKELNRLKPDIYHGLSNELPLGIKKTGIKTIVTIHDLIFERFPHLYPVTDRRIYRYKFRNACLVADMVIAVSESTRKDIIEYYHIAPEKIHVAYQTCNPAFQVLKSKEQRDQVLTKYELPAQFLLSVGTLEERKNMMVILQALKISKHKTPLVLVGRPTPYKEHLLDYALKNDLLDQVIFRQNITNQDLPAIYQSAEALIYPSVYEGFGIPILEALYSGVPVLTGTGSCLPETAGEAALFFNVNEPEELADHISKILSDRGLKEALIQKGKIQAEKFNGEKIAGRIMELYQMLL